MPVRKTSPKPQIRDQVSRGRPADGRTRSAATEPPLVDGAALEEIFRRFAETSPAPRGELEHQDAYQLLVAVVLSAQATDRSVNLATGPLFALADTPAAMVALGEDGLIEHIRTIGLFRTKARNVIALSQRLLDEHGGIVPPSRTYLESLPGVGRKSASVVLNSVFGEPTIAVDTHVFRVSHRIPIARGRTPDDVQRELEARIPSQYRLYAHHWLILHGRYTCKARTPDCPGCLIRDLCRYPDKTPPA
ncbi:MAG: endonuclease III [Methylobacteriaceae bacterium]|nr:endonuclease III [Methylobacteriaceae bacterium]